MDNYICPDCSWQGDDQVCPVCESLTEPIEEETKSDQEELPKDLDDFDEWEESEDDEA